MLNEGSAHSGYQYYQDDADVDYFSCHPLRFPSRKLQAVEVIQNAVRHLLRLIMNLICLIIQRREPVPHRMEQISPVPVKHRHNLVVQRLDDGGNA